MKVNCFIKEPGKKPRQAETLTDWESIQNIVGAPTDFDMLGSDSAIVFDALAFSKGAAHCCEVKGRAYYGTVLFIGADNHETHITLAEHPAKNVRDFEINTDIYY